MKKLIWVAFCVGIGCCNSPVFAGSSTIRWEASDPYNAGSVPAGSQTKQSIEFVAIGGSSQISSLSVTGGGFLLAGGTCGVGVDLPPLCTVVIEFAPSSPGPASGNLFVNCVSDIIIGGVTITCDGAGQNIGLTGIGGAAVSVPTVSPAALTALALLLLATTLWTLRRRRK